ncbi:centaurin-gamma-1A-like isoform X2 [Babylonia areolata]|uniref:centaurin-gamma-1A-like isoform X2 n=1 Tax=Babylonia areolata TaxID=304850 RepID=UPI003FD54646
MKMNVRSPMQSYWSNSLAVRQEIQRFESVHPSIYAIYDLIEAIPDPLIQQQIREHVVCIEDSFVNSQEWTLSRAVPDLKLGILGSTQSGKSALVHRYLTGSYMQEESPEGGRFKKEVIIDGQSYLLLVRDEGGSPEMQFSHWVDAVIFVFSLENEISFQAVYSHFARLAQYRDTKEIPLILVGTQDAISENNPRVIDDTRARQLANDLKRCSYYETCATYGLNVERVFQDACSRIVQMRYPNNAALIPASMAGTPGQCQRSFYALQTAGKACDSHSSSSQSTSSSGTLPAPQTDKDSSGSKGDQRRKDKHIPPHPMPLLPPPQPQPPPPPQIPPPSTSHLHQSPLTPLTPDPEVPTRSREEEKKEEGEKVGVGRAIPVKQGYLYKKSTGLNKEWKKKYCALMENGKLSYHPSLQDYMDDVRAKEIALMHTTVKIPGMRPRGSRVSSTASNNPPESGDMNTSTGFELTQEGGTDSSLVIRNSSIISGLFDRPRKSLTPNVPKLGINSSNKDTPSVKKRHRRAKSGGVKHVDPKDGDESDGYEFTIVSLDNKQWQFEAQNADDRDDWVDAIEQQILSCLQGNDILGKSRKQSNLDQAFIQTIRTTRGNTICVDCGTPSPSWASINLGVVMCIECSGVHRNIGTHISRVRSLDLDDWPPEVTKVMTSIGNYLANSVWEANTRGRSKPTSSSNREEKEAWIKAKYENKEFLPPLPYIDIPVNQQLIDALVREDIRNIIVILSQATADDINAPYSKDDGRTALHIAAALGNVVFLQLLLWYGASVKVVDHEGRNALWYAKTSGSVECSDLLTSAGCADLGMLPQQRGHQRHSKNDMYGKLPASVI